MSGWNNTEQHLHKSAFRFLAKAWESCRNIKNTRRKYCKLPRLQDSRFHSLRRITWLSQDGVELLKDFYQKQIYLSSTKGLVFSSLTDSWIGLFGFPPCQRKVDALTPPILGFWIFGEILFICLFVFTFFEEPISVDHGS